MISLAIAHEILMQGAAFGLVLIAVFISSRIMHLDDLTVEGSFGAGGAIAALISAVHGGVVASLVGAAVCGTLAGIATGFLHAHLGLSALMSGLCVTAVLFSCCLAMVGPYVALKPAACLRACVVPGPLVVIFLLVVLLFGVIWFLRTQIGLWMRATGENQDLVRSMHKNPAVYTALALALANGITAVAGGVFVLHNGFFSATASMGVLITALSSLMLGSLVNAQLGLRILSGAFLYQFLFVCILALGVDPLWNNALRALFIIILFVLTTKKKGMS